MELKEYQQAVLDTLDAYLDELLKQEIIAEKVRKSNEGETDPDLIRPIPDFPSRAWEHLKAIGRLPTFRKDIPWSGRKDGLGKDVPNICFKVPTGGGKTLLSAYAVSRIMGRYLRRNHGFVLWIVPNEAIYSQTKKHLNNREHPYRQILDRAAAGRVKILEKSDSFGKIDVESHLCVMLLMLQAANRETKETLRLFRDRGNVHGFFPPADDIVSQFKLLGEISNLSCYGNRDYMGSIAHESLGNVLRLLGPIVVMDEGHKAYTASAMSTIYDFNPRFVLELSATPKDRLQDTPPKYANWLADVRGVELQREEMIKLPINVTVKAGDDWRECLSDSLDHLKILQIHADKLRANTSRYIRPILLVQVERTGKDQRENQFIHSDDVKELLLGLGLDETEIAIKTAEKNELKEPENIDLLSETCSVRVIITKQALQEGWDCPFAYVLCALAANRNLGAMTQLVGRILRQPHAACTPDPLLNECYVFCHHAKTKEVIEAIKDGLEQDGMADIAGQIREKDPNAKPTSGRRTLPRREKFSTLQVYLPLVNWVQEDQSRLLDYEGDVLSRLDWGLLDLTSLAQKLATDVSEERTQMIKVSLSKEPSGEFLETKSVGSAAESISFDPVYATRMVMDIVPNPWVARGMIGELIEALVQRGFDNARLGRAATYIVEELRKWLADQRDTLAEEQFLRDVEAGRIQFRLRADRSLWRMPKEIETDRPANAAQLVRNSGGAIEKSVFAPVYRDDFNSDEAEFACYLDEQVALRWWHRNVAKASYSYSIQGWKKPRVYPDFVFAHERKGSSDLIRVWETKGNFLEGNLDTAYKEKLLKLMSTHFLEEHAIKAGTLELVGREGELVECDLVLMDEWKTAVSQKLKDA